MRRLWTSFIIGYVLLENNSDGACPVVRHFWCFFPMQKRTPSSPTNFSRTGCIIVNIKNACSHSSGISWLELVVVSGWWYSCECGFSDQWQTLDRLLHCKLHIYVSVIVEWCTIQFCPKKWPKFGGKMKNYKNK